MSVVGEVMGHEKGMEKICELDMELQMAGGANVRDRTVNTWRKDSQA